jgi:hypothetical protein
MARRRRVIAGASGIHHSHFTARGFHIQVSFSQSGDTGVNTTTGNGLPLSHKRTTYERSGYAWQRYFARAKERERVRG